MTVIDASVALEWLIGRPRAVARAILEGHIAGTAPLVAPDLLHYEIGNVLITRTTLPAREVTDLFDHCALTSGAPGTWRRP